LARDTPDRRPVEQRPAANATVISMPRVGGLPHRYVNRTSSVLQIAQREGNRESISGRVSLGSGGLGAILEGPLRKGKGSWIFSGKRKFIDVFTRDIGIGDVSGQPQLQREGAL